MGKVVYTKESPEALDPVRVSKIKNDVIRKMMFKYSRMNLDRAELVSEAEIVILNRYQRYNRGWGSIYCYFYRFLMYELDKHIQRKMIPGMTRIGKMPIVNICTSELKYGELNPQISCVNQVEARDSLAKIKERLKKSDVETLELMEEGLNQTEIGEVLGISRQAISKRFVRIRKIGKEVLGLTD